MNTKKENKEVTLGLDLGVGSVGWSVVETTDEGDKKTTRIIESGVELFKSVSSAKERREKRGTRRGIRRKQYKLNKIRNTIINTVDENKSNLFGFNDKKELVEFLEYPGYILVEKDNKYTKRYIIDILKEQFESANIKMDVAIKELLINSNNYNITDSELDLIDISSFINEYRNNILLIRSLLITLIASKEYDFDKENESTKYLIRKLVIKLIYDYYKNRGYFYETGIDIEELTGKTVIYNFPTVKCFYNSIIDKKLALEFNFNLKNPGTNKKNDPEIDNYSNKEWANEFKWILDKIYNDDKFESFKEQLLDTFSYTRDFSEGPGSKFSYSKYGIYSEEFINNQSGQKEHKKIYNNIWDKTVGKCSVYNRINGYKSDLIVSNTLNLNYNIFDTLNILNNIFNEDFRSRISFEQKEKIILSLCNVGLKVKKIKNELSIDKLKEILELKNKSFSEFVNECLTKNVANQILKEYSLEYSNQNNIDPQKFDKKLSKDIVFKFPNFDYVNLYVKGTGQKITKLSELYELDKLFKKITQILEHNYKKENRLINLKQLKELRDFSSEIIDAFSELKSKFGNLSEEALVKFNRANLESKQDTNKSITFSYWKEEEIKRIAILNQNNKEIKFNLNEFMFSRGLNNSTQKTIRICDKLVKKIIDSLKAREIHIDNIVIEVARELNKSEKTKQNISKTNNQLNILREVIKNKLSKVRINDVSSNLIKKIILWFEQDGIDLYTGKEIIDPFTNFKEFNTKYEIDHIIPQSKYFDSKLQNLVLTDKDANKKKSNKTAYDYLTENKTLNKMYFEWKKIYKPKNDKSFKFEKLVNFNNDTKVNNKSAFSLDTIKKYLIQNRKQKLKNLFRTENDISSMDFLNSKLQDTQTASVVSLEWFKNKYKNDNIKIIPFKGIVTSNISYLSKLPKKDRNYNFHHAIDASIIATSYNNSKTFHNLITEQNVGVNLNLMKSDYLIEDFNNVRESVSNTLPSANDENGVLKYDDKVLNKIKYTYHSSVKTNKKILGENKISGYLFKQGNEFFYNTIEKRSALPLIKTIYARYNEYKDKEINESFFEFYKHKKENNYYPIWVLDNYLTQFIKIYNSIIKTVTQCKLQQHDHYIEENDKLDDIDRYMLCLSNSIKKFESIRKNNWFIYAPLDSNSNKMIVVKQLTTISYSNSTLKSTIGFDNDVNEMSNKSDFTYYKVGNLLQHDEFYYGILCLKVKDQWQYLRLESSLFKNDNYKDKLLKVLAKNNSKKKINKKDKEMLIEWLKCNFSSINWLEFDKNNKKKIFDSLVYVYNDLVFKYSDENIDTKNYHVSHNLVKIETIKYNDNKYKNIADANIKYSSLIQNKENFEPKLKQNANNGFSQASTKVSIFIDKFKPY
ncbi:CRISPR-associated endonuclease Cas9 [Mycoplasma anatis]|uniref:CRISPR-associated endonuclease Cas9 n=1 Tax=Mycoplasmopsis anatis TaxID=171279 RepID=A0A9Q3L9F6_9BACT|nr:type II CRISPR RNA-guided endonuclease Cas9 [Mycoplasmopsis anatis]MBW0599422.1 CRISPR-associated endonuclease Cas9 [Mycoplasmopsis anatis]MBW0602555.1 CRISPR-associated endonuclease Cas9 [Mycoplasmopsis anatis]MBW0604182.1 CRISPR-associated endonuclease Cas9 [Mycoplasmopsis anatis]